jgi:hypothetical protein
MLHSPPRKRLAISSAKTGCPAATVSRAFPGKTLPPLRNIFETPRQSLEAIQTAANGEVLGLVAVGCVDYGFVARPEHHQTGFAFEVSRKAAAIPGERCCAIDFFENDVPATDLRVTLYPFGGFYAD